MYPQDCPAFEYDEHPDRGRCFPGAIRAALRLLQNPVPLQLEIDTRPLHRRLFRELCPDGCEYYAGHYRGEEFRCLKHYSVHITMDERVGAPAPLVAPKMQQLARMIQSSMAALDAAHEHPPSRLKESDKALFSVAFACRIFVEFLTVHPYANGNGHIARWLLAAVLRSHGYRLDDFPVDPRPADPPYSDMISRYRDGEVGVLERYVFFRLS